MIETQVGVPTVLVALLLGGAGAPFPEELALVTLGYLAWRGEAPLALVLGLAWIAVVTADLGLYLVGRLSRRVPFVAALLRGPRAEKLRRHLPRLLIFGRFLVGARAIFLLVAGAAHVPMARFLAYDLVAASVSVGLLVGLGMYFAPSIDRLWPTLVRLEIGLLIAAPVMLLLGLRRQQA